MNKLEALLEEAVLTAPLSLLNIKDPVALEYINNMLPFSTGFEIECPKKLGYNIDNFKGIPDIIDINVDSSEQRYRIPNGLSGIICLYNISQQLILNSELNPLSGIHYHIDMTKTFSHINASFIEANKEWILQELDSWDEKGSYNSRDVRINSTCWLRFSSEHRTAEFRIGEMTFDYKLLIKRIIHCNNIVRRINKILGFELAIKFKDLNSYKILEYINTVNMFDGINELETLRKELEEFKVTKISEEEMINSIKNRTIKITTNGTVAVKESL